MEWSEINSQLDFNSPKSPIQSSTNDQTCFNTKTEQSTQSNLPIDDTQSNLRVDDEGWLFLQTPTSDSTSQSSNSFIQLKEQILRQINPALSDFQKQQIIDLVLKYKHLIPENSKKPAITPILEHHIENSKVTFVKPYRLSRAEYDKAETLVKEMFKDGIIQRSSSPYNAPIVMARKKDGSIRFCIDFRELNKVTKVCKYPLTNPYSCFDELGKSFFFTSLDLASAYWSIPLAEDDKEKTAFTVRSGKYEFTVVPFGLTNAVATFCALMDLIFTGMQWSFVMCFVDDCLIYSVNDFDLHLQHIEAVFKKLEAANLSLKLTKCHFAQYQVEFYGHLISNTGLKMLPSKIEAIQKSLPPKDKTGLRHIMGSYGTIR